MSVRPTRYSTLLYSLVSDTRYRSASTRTVAVALAIQSQSQRQARRGASLSAADPLLLVTAAGGDAPTLHCVRLLCAEAAVAAASCERCRGSPSPVALESRAPHLLTPSGGRRRSTRTSGEQSLSCSAPPRAPPQQVSEERRGEERRAAPTRRDATAQLIASISDPRVRARADSRDAAALARGPSSSRRPARRRPRRVAERRGEEMRRLRELRAAHQIRIKIRSAHLMLSVRLGD